MGRGNVHFAHNSRIFDDSAAWDYATRELEGRKTKAAGMQSNNDKELEAILYQELARGADE
jgi:hypothetical protein